MAASTRGQRRQKQNGAQNNNEVVTLQVRGVEKMAFVDHQYNAEVYLMRGTKLVTGVPVTLAAHLLYEDGTPASDGVLRLASECIRISKSQHHATLSYNFKDSSLLHDNRKFRIQVRALGKYSRLRPVVTEPIEVIKYKLQVSDSLPPQFFKDQGGRDKHMVLNVQLTDAQGKPVRLAKSMPLTAKLCYEKSQRLVPNQEILKLMAHSKLSVGKDGRTKVTFRIEEVSSRHQRQNFRLCIAPDVERCPLNGDILAAYSSGVTVRSKKTGAPRKRKVQYPAPGINPQIGQSLEEAMQASKRARPDAVNAMHAIQDLIQWSTRTRDMLQILQFQHIGYDLNRDGSPNLELKISRCPSCFQSSSGLQNNHAPDCTMNKILSVYAQRIGPGIATIMKSIEVGVCTPPALPVRPDPVSFTTSEVRTKSPCTTVDNPNNCGEFRMNSLELPPPLPKLEKSGSGGSFSGIWTDIQPLMMDFGSPHDPEGESSVYYGYAKPFHNGATNWGFPAFDKAGKLKGFFQKTSTGLNEPMGFLPLAAVGVDRARVQQLNKEFEKTLREMITTSDSCIKCINDYVDLTHMKQDICVFADLNPAGNIHTSK